MLTDKKREDFKRLEGEVFMDDLKPGSDLKNGEWNEYTTYKKVAYKRAWGSNVYRHVEMGAFVNQ